MTLRVHYLQHVPFEDLGSIRATLEELACPISCSRLYLDEPLPDVDDFDWLIVMGGPMGVDELDKYPWLVDEKELIKQAIDAGKRVLGICLGAQLIADVLGAPVTSNLQREIGWHDIRLSGEAELTWLAEIFPARFPVFHWHGETFLTPGGAITLASSEACMNQGFVYQERVIALQFHLESTPQSVQALIKHCGDELDNSTYVQQAEQMLAKTELFEQINQLMDELLRQLIQDD